MKREREKEKTGTKLTRSANDERECEEIQKARFGIGTVSSDGTMLIENEFCFVRIGNV